MLGKPTRHRLRFGININNTYPYLSTYRYITSCVGSGGQGCDASKPPAPSPTRRGGTVWAPVYI